jgi:hypothetical protein
MSQIPRFICFLELLRKPKWGVENEIYVYIFFYKSFIFGNAALIIKPPIECPIKEIWSIKVFYSFINLRISFN